MAPPRPRGVGVVLYGADERVSVAGVEAARLLGVADPSALIGRGSLFEFAKIFGPNGASVCPAIEPGVLALRTGECHRAVVLGIRSKADHIRWFRVTAEPLFRIGSDLPYAAVSRFEPLQS